MGLFRSNLDVQSFILFYIFYFALGMELSVHTALLRDEFFRRAGDGQIGKGVAHAVAIVRVFVVVMWGVR